MRKNKLRVESSHGVGLIMVMSLALLSMSLTGAMVTMLVSSANQSNMVKSWEESYGTGLGAIHKTIFQIEAACGGASPPGTLKEVETYLTEQLGGGHTGTYTFTGSIDGNSYSVELTDPTPHHYR